MKEIKFAKNWLSSFNKAQSAVDDIDVILEFVDLGEATEEELEEKYQLALKEMEEIEFKSTLNKPEDELSCFVEINSGAGGTEACDWSSILLRMYKMWGERNGFKVSIINQQDGDVAGVKTAELEINGDFAYGMLKGENGVHRLVRVSPFNAQGKRMTSFSSIFVHPLVDDRIEVQINPQLILEWDTFRSSGAGDSMSIKQNQQLGSDTCQVELWWNASKSDHSTKTETRQCKCSSQNFTNESCSDNLRNATKSKPLK